jgi:hypothetical protein
MGAPAPGAYQGLTPPGVETIVVNWRTMPGKHPQMGRNAYNVIVTDKRIIVGKASLMAKLGSGMALGGAMSAVTAGVAQAAAASAVAGLGAAMSRSTWANIDENRNIASAELDQLLVEKPELVQIPNQFISQVRLKKGGILGTDRVFFVLPEGEFSGEIGGYKDTVKAFQQIFPGRLVTV